MGELPSVLGGGPHQSPLGRGSGSAQGLSRHVFSRDVRRAPAKARTGCHQDGVGPEMSAMTDGWGGAVGLSQAPLGLVAEVE